MNALVWWNGRVAPFAEATVHVTSETAQRGVNAFEGMRAYWRPDSERLAIVSMGEHLDRLRMSLKLLRLPAETLVEPMASALVELTRALSAREDLYLRPTIYLDSGSYTSDPARCAFGAFVSARPAPSRCPPVSCHVSSLRRVPSQAFPAQAKSGASYAIFRLARVEAAGAGYDESILLNEHGHVAETGGASIFIVADGAVATPRISDGILESITRRHALAILRDRLGVHVTERAIGLPELLAADEVFLTGTLDEVRLVDRVHGGRSTLRHEVGPVVRDAYLGMCRGQAEPLNGSMFAEVAL